MTPSQIRAWAEKLYSEVIDGLTTPYGVESAAQDLIAAVRAETMAEAADMIPRSWLDPLLTGPEAILHGSGPYTGTDIENLLRAIRSLVKERKGEA